MKPYSLVWDHSFFTDAVSMFGSARAWDQISWTYLELFLDPACYPVSGAEYEFRLACCPSFRLSFIVNQDAGEITLLNLRQP
jgi:hypothetical protein